MSLVIKFYFTSSMLNMFRALIHPSSGACDFSVVSPQWSCVLVSMCVGSFGVAGLGWYPGGRLLPASIYTGLILPTCALTSICTACPLLSLTGVWVMWNSCWCLWLIPWIPYFLCRHRILIDINHNAIFVSILNTVGYFPCMSSNWLGYEARCFNA